MLLRINRPSLELRIHRTNNLKDKTKQTKAGKKERPFTEHPDYSPGFHKPLLGLCNHGDGGATLGATLVLEGDLLCLPGDIQKCSVRREGRKDGWVGEWMDTSTG